MTECDGGRPRGDRVRSRRQVLAATASAASLVGLAGCGGGSGDGGSTTPTPSKYANYPVTGDTVKIGAAIPQTGEHSQEGEQLLAGYRLAARNVNDGVGLAGEKAFSAISSGLRGRDVELVVENTDSSAEGARSAANALIEEGAIALVGGASNAEAAAVHDVADEENIVNMVGFAPGNAIGGEDCSLYGFQEMYNAIMTAQALRPVLIEEFGDQQNFAQLHPESSVGKDFAAAMHDQMSNEANWFPLTAESTKVGTKNFEGPIQAALDRDPAVLVLNYYGLSGALVLQQAREVVPDDVGITVPLMNRPMARVAEGALADVVGTVTWDVTIDSEISTLFRDAWKSAGFTQEKDRLSEPGGLGHLAYFQFLQYAAAVERAGTFDPMTVIDRIHNYKYDVGLGEQKMRKCDHQAVRPVPVVRGRTADEQAFSRYFEVIDVRADGVGYGCTDPPAENCYVRNRG